MVTNVTREFLLIIQDKIGVKNNTITRLISISSMIFFYSTFNLSFNNKRVYIRKGISNRRI